MLMLVLAVVALAVANPATAQERSRPRSPAAGQSVLASLVADLEQRNPQLGASRREIDMRVARIAPAGAPPDPTLSVGYMSGFLRPPFFPSAGTPDRSCRRTS